MFRADLEFDLGVYSPSRGIEQPAFPDLLGTSLIVMAAVVTMRFARNRLTHL